MDGIREWGYSLCAAAIACGMIQVLIPNAGAGRVMRMTVSVFFLCCLFSPLVLRVPELAEIPQSTAQAKADEIDPDGFLGEELRVVQDILAILTDGLVFQQGQQFGDSGFVGNAVFQSGQELFASLFLARGLGLAGDDLDSLDRSGAGLRLGSPTEVAPQS